MRLNPNRVWFTLLLGACAGLPALSIDLSAPTLALLPSALGTTVIIAGLSLSLFMVGFALGQFVGGRASDRSGRRPVLLVALIIYTISGVCCAIATSGPQLAAARLVQGAGAGACSVQAFAIVQDLFRGEAARRKQAYVSVVLTIMPMLAPALGALLMAQSSWRAVHAVLAVAGMLLAAAVVLLLEESRPASVRTALPGLGIKDGLAMLRDDGFRRVAVVNALSYGTIFAYIAGAPVVVMSQLNYPPMVYAALFASTALALSAGATSNAVLSRRGVGSFSLIWPGLVAQAGATLAMAMAGTSMSMPAIWLVVPALLICCFARGVVSPNLVHLAISVHRENAGLASAIVGLMQLLVGAASSALVAALLPTFGFSGVAVPMAALSCAAAVIWGARVRRNQRSELPDPIER